MDACDSDVDICAQVLPTVFCSGVHRRPWGDVPRPREPGPHHTPRSIEAALSMVLANATVLHPRERLHSRCLAFLVVLFLMIECGRVLVCFLIKN
jgi:hypothetical protein